MIVLESYDPDKIEDSAISVFFAVNEMQDSFDKFDISVEKIELNENPLEPSKASEASGYIWPIS